MGKVGRDLCVLYKFDITRVRKLKWFRLTLLASIVSSSVLLAQKICVLQERE
jgi:hypothetical protein